jgi:hypothetical protein
VIVVLTLARLPAREFVPHRVGSELRAGPGFTRHTPAVRIATVLVGALPLTTVNAQATVQLMEPRMLRGWAPSVCLLVFSGLIPLGAARDQLAEHLGSRAGLINLGIVRPAATFSLRSHPGDTRRALKRLEARPTASL